SVADYLHASFPGGLEKVCIIFPNRRASLYFNKYLAEQMEGPIWAPPL
ncbi:MAG: hypothetical protein HC830_06880, partial [Bacteroidetes bacterium]|nr:hypothetical protein [Bacteroidota bacterium]